MRIYLVRIPRRKGHSIQRVVLPGFSHCWRKLLHPRSHSSWPQREGSQVATGQLRSNNRAEASFLITPLCFVRFDSHFGTPIITLTWAEDRATVGTDLSAVPGAKTEWGGTRPPSAIRDWHQRAKSSCRRLLPSSVAAPPCLPTRLLLPWHR